MPRTCSICQHVQREAIDAALVAGEPFRAIARQYATSKDALRRHAQDHLPAALLQAKGAAEVAHGAALAERPILGAAIFRPSTPRNQRCEVNLRRFS